ncbi:MAG: hypothetical protein JKY92_02725 [Magnetovibrio sp.]|nr:hypothetical protein [Magnetovibrio sp.]
MAHFVLARIDLARTTRGAFILGLLSVAQPETFLSSSPNICISGLA